jgi:tetratricopeptide (TPR) repeat protein
MNLAATAAKQLRDDAAAQDLVGWIAVQRKLAWYALPYLEDAVRLAPGNAVYRYHLGVAYRDADTPDKAREQLARALQLDGSLTPARTALASLGQ